MTFDVTNAEHVKYMPAIYVFISGAGNNQSLQLTKMLRNVYFLFNIQFSPFTLRKDHL